MALSKSAIEGYETRAEEILEDDLLQEVLDINEDVATEAERVNFTFYSNEFRIIRYMLRCLSLWHPRSASCIESVAYPIFINVMLFMCFAATALAPIWKRPNWLHQYVSFYVEGAIYLGIYLTHLFGVLYFRSRDLEDDMVNIELEPDLAIKFRHSLKLLTTWSMLTLLSLIILLNFLKVSLSGGSCESELPNDLLTYIMCWLGYPLMVYDVGISLSISWAIYLLQQAAYIRLEQLEKRYCLWKATAEDAIYDYLINYSRKIEKSCNVLGKWFLAHNFILVLAGPFLIYYVIQAVKIIKQDPIDRTFFVLCYSYAILIWVTPLLFAERLQIHDDHFISSINKLCPGVILEAIDMPSQNSRQNSTEETFTFQSRSEVNKFLTYLKSRKSGFLVGSYSFQLKLSMFSFGLAFISFTTRV